METALSLYAQSIALALELEVDLVPLDEREGRRVHDEARARPFFQRIS